MINKISIVVVNGNMYFSLNIRFFFLLFHICFTALPCKHKLESIATSAPNKTEQPSPVRHCAWRMFEQLENIMWTFYPPRSSNVSAYVRQIHKYVVVPCPILTCIPTSRKYQLRNHGQMVLASSIRFLRNSPRNGISFEMEKCKYIYISWLIVRI